MLPSKKFFKPISILSWVSPQRKKVLLGSGGPTPKLSLTTSVYSGSANLQTMLYVPSKFKTSPYLRNNNLVGKNVAPIYVNKVHF